MADEVDVTVEDVEISTGGGFLQTLVDVPKNVDKMIVGTAKNVVSAVSPGLADSLVSLDKSFKDFWWGLFKGTANTGLGLVGLKIK
jgi:hypothetical protein